MNEAALIGLEEPRERTGQVVPDQISLRDAAPNRQDCIHVVLGRAGPKLGLEQSHCDRLKLRRDDQPLRVLRSIRWLALSRQLALIATWALSNDVSLSETAGEVMFETVSAINRVGIAEQRNAIAADRRVVRRAGVQSVRGVEFLGAKERLAEL